MLDNKFFAELVLKTLTNIKNSIFKVNVVNQQPFPKEITIKNPAQFPNEVKISNLKETKTAVQEVSGIVDINRIEEVINTLRELANKKPVENIKPDETEIKEVAVKDFDKLLNKQDKEFPKSLEITNLSDVIYLLEKIKNKTNSVYIPDTFRVSNLDEIKLPKVEEVAFRDLDKLLSSLENLKLISNNPRKPIAVRLSDGEKYYNSIAQAIVSSSGGKATSANQVNGDQKTRIVNGSGDEVFIWDNGAIVCTDAVHKRIIDSEEFLSSYCFIDVADDASVYLHIKTGDKTLHGNVSIESDGKCYGNLYENPTITDDGTGLLENCLNRETIVVPESTIFYTPTVSADGTCIECRLLGAAGMFTASGGNITDAYWLLDHNKSYLVKITNKSGSASDICINLQWHEHTAV